MTRYSAFTLLTGSIFWLVSTVTLAQADWQRQLNKAESRYGKTSKKYVSVLHDLFHRLYTDGHYTDAIRLEKEAMRLEGILYGEDSYDYAVTACNLASVSLLLDEDMAEHEGRLKKVMPILEREEPAKLASLYSMLGHIYAHSERFDEAVTAFETGIRLARSNSDSQETSLPSLLNGLGKLYGENGNLSRAGLHFAEALKFMETHQMAQRNPIFYLTTKQNLATSMGGVGQWQRGAQLLEEVASGLRSMVGEQHPRYSPVVINLAYFYYQLSRYQEGLDRLLNYRLVMNRQTDRNPLLYAHLMNSISQFQRKLNQSDEAAASSEEALQVARPVIGSKNNVYISFLENWCFSQWQRKRAGDVVGQIPAMSSVYMDRLFGLFTVSAEYERLRVVDELTESFDFHRSFAAANPTYITLPGYVYDEELALKGAVLNSTRQLLDVVSKSRDTSVRQLFRDWTQLRDQLSTQQQLPLADQDADVASLEKRTAEAEQALIQKSQAFRQFANDQKLSWVTVRDSLRPGEAAVEFITYELRRPQAWTDSIMYAALVLRPGYNRPVLIPLCKESRLQRFMGTGSASPTTAPNRGGEVIGRNSQPDSVYRLIWQPIDSLLSGARTVFYAPAGLLHKISFIGLKNKLGLLGYRYALRQVTSSRFVVTRGRPVCLPDTASVVAFGGLNYDKQLISPGTRPISVFMDMDTLFTNVVQRFDSLPGTTRELDAIRLLLPGRVKPVQGSEGTEEALKALSGRSPYVLHLATHGYFIPAPATGKLIKSQFPGEMDYQPANNSLLRSGLIVAGGNTSWQTGKRPPDGDDGILTAEEVARLDLSRTELVVLSACQTGLGDLRTTEGVFGLQRAFKQAGTKRLLISLQNVSDSGTVLFMTEFYKALAHHEEIHDAFAATWKTLQKRFPNQSSRWANFILIE